MRSRVEIPAGVQCFVGDEALRRRAIEERAVGVFEGWDYEEIIPPLFDYADGIADPSLAAKTYSFVSRDGSLLALRPDFTALIAKIAAGRLVDRKPPIRLYYSGEVLRYEPPKAGRQSELYQMGLEHLGGDRAFGDAEVLAIACETLETLGAKDFVVAVGHVGVFDALADHLALTPTEAALVRDRVASKDPNGVGEALSRTGRTSQAASALATLPTWTGRPSVLAEAESALASLPAAVAALRELRVSLEALEAAGLGHRVSVDLGEAAGLDYYTGLVFRIYAPRLGFDVGAGGRYDALLSRFGRDLPAVGFMLGLDRVALLLEKQGAAEPPARPLAVSVGGPDVATALAEARSRRSKGERVRFGNGRSK